MPSIYDSLGGEPAMHAAVDDFYERVVADPTLAHYFAAVDMARLKAHQRAFLTSALGGPARYRGRSMNEAHQRLDVTRAAFDRVVGHLMATLTSFGVDGDTCSAIGHRLTPLRADVVASR